MDTHEEASGGRSALVRVARFTDPTEAQFALGAVEAAGIDAVLQGEEANNLYPGMLTTELLVSSADEAAARELLESDGGEAATSEEMEGEQ
jgi:hypothetical protein